MTASPPPAGPRTQEIPLAPTGATAAGAAEQHPAPRPGPPSSPAPGTATTAVQPRVEDPAPVQAAGPQPTGPLDSWFGAPPAPPAAAHPAPQATPAQHPGPRPDGATRRAPRSPRDRALLAGAGLVGLSLVLLELGLALRFGGDPLWSGVPLWSAFATLAVLVGALPFVPRLHVPGGAAGAERIALGGLAGLAVFWVLVVLPRADTDRGFLLTAAVAALGVALWLAPGRRR
ncbi:hypothetical protein JOD57_002495 [Geodermatophilus bullaregiensis]|uniref:hypothetical protein n=1 Tax=Geodermatophilus bullaregiensis TaxID=1564160 RepID=UPI00195B6052|nr:hypothetical protein [Geodermatophilus bullaregiensis]MBM7806658.1 hypothetical protein [Geodermatophilus bullaregiensis]